MTRIIRAGIVQQSCSTDIKTNLEKLHRNIASLAQAGANLVVLQELHNTPYFCQTEDTSLFDLAEPIPGPSTGFYSEIDSNAAHRDCITIQPLYSIQTEA